MKRLKGRLVVQQKMSLVTYYSVQLAGETLTETPYRSGRLRLYCGRYSSRIVILCNGGVKSSNRPEDSPDCSPHFLLMNAIMKEINRKVWDKELSVEDDELSGDLNFEIGNYYE